MAKKANRSVETFTYTPKADRTLPAAEQSQFRFRPLTQAERMYAMDTMESVTIATTGERTVQPRSFQHARELVLLSLVEAQNFPAGEAQPYPVSGSRTDKERYLDTVDDLLIFEFGTHIFTRSALGGEEKNFSTPSDTQS